MRFPDAEGVDDPVELLVAVVVLGGPESVGHALQTVHDGAGKVIGRVDSEGKGVAGIYFKSRSEENTTLALCLQSATNMMVAGVR